MTDSLHLIELLFSTTSVPRTVFLLEVKRKCEHWPIENTLSHLGLFLRVLPTYRET